MAICRPLLIGLAGPSGAGKSTLCAAIAADRGDVGHFRLDDFFKDATEFPRYKHWLNRELPSNLKFDQFITALTQLRAGYPVEVPEYSMHADRAVGTKRVEPKQVILVEGYLLFHDPRARPLFDLRLFLDVTTEVQIARRLGRGIPFDAAYFYEVVVPTFEQYGRDAQYDAHIVIDGNGPIEDTTRNFLAIVNDSVRQFA
ncbi:hypothetical protein HYS28_03730 [Candidatus Uhrbacteria bacterium]|nr:hypothetical protein [Candidatus Uhrbacteria bacterium]